jgi:chorismate mutase / prephenate dehydratase
VDSQVLGALRTSITNIDNQIIELITQRRAVARSIAQYKQSNNIPIRDRARERDLLCNLITRSEKNGLSPGLITHLFERIIQDSIQHQQNVVADYDQRQNNRVAFLGAKGSYSYLAANEYFSSTASLDLIGYGSFAEIIQSVEIEEADFAILPIENTTSGSINEVYDLLGKANLIITGEQLLKISHCLVGLPNANSDLVRQVRTHPQAYLQCKSSLDAMDISDIKFQESTAAGVKAVKELNDPGIAAIASPQSAALYGLEIIKSSIADQDSNHSRFIILASKEQQIPSHIDCKTSLVFQTPQTAGALFGVLNIFQNNNINLLKLESRPIANRPWQERFYLDIEANLYAVNTQAALEQLAKLVIEFKVLGCYQQTVQLNQVMHHPTIKKSDDIELYD